MPSHAFAIFADGEPIEKDVTNDISAVDMEAPSAAPDILLRLNDLGNKGQRRVQNPFPGRGGVVPVPPDE